MVGIVEAKPQKIALKINYSVLPYGIGGWEWRLMGVRPVMNSVMFDHAGAGTAHGKEKTASAAYLRAAAIAKWPQPMEQHGGELTGLLDMFLFAGSYSDRVLFVEPVGKEWQARIEERDVPLCEALGRNPGEAVILAGQKTLDDGGGWVAPNGALLTDHPK